MNRLRLPFVPAAVAVLVLAACTPLGASSATPWPPVWQDRPAVADTSPIRFDAPSADDCHRLPTEREVPGRDPQAVRDAEPAHEGRRARLEARHAAERSKVAAPAARADVADAAAVAETAPSIAPGPAPAPTRQRQPDGRPVTAGMVDDNADFGAYLSYREKVANGLVVRDRDVRERYALEVTDADGRPVHDAEVAVQQAGVAQPVAWARTDTAGRVWLHPRAFLPANVADTQVLGIAVRKGGQQARTVLTRGQKQALQVRLDGAARPVRPRLDLVFLVDATGSMGDEIAKLKASMHAMSQQIGQMPGRPDICYGLVAYRDRGDAFLTRTHDFTDRLDAFQQALGRVQANGGGDTPEALDEAFAETVHGLAWRRDAVRLVVLVADAPPHADRQDGPRYDREMQAALAKGIKVLPVGASGLDPAGEYTFRQLAQYTGGRFVFLTYKDAADPSSGPGSATVHDVNAYSVDTLDRLVVRLVRDELARLPKA